MIKNIIKTLLTVAVLFFGIIYCIMAYFMSESKYAYYELKPTQVQQKTFARSLKIELPDKCKITKMKRDIFFFDPDDDPINLIIYSNLTVEEWKQIFDGGVGKELKGTSDSGYNWRVNISFDKKNRLIIHGSARDVDSAVGICVNQVGEYIDTKMLIMNFVRPFILIFIIILVWIPKDAIKLFDIRASVSNAGENVEDVVDVDNKTYY